jgi:hypothetical protein
VGAGREAALGGRPGAAVEGAVVIEVPGAAAIVPSASVEVSAKLTCWPATERPGLREGGRGGLVGRGRVADHDLPGGDGGALSSS